MVPFAQRFAALDNEGVDVFKGEGGECRVLTHSPHMWRLVRLCSAPGLEDKWRGNVCYDML